MLGSGDESCRAALGLRAGAPVARPRPRVSRCSVCARSVVRRSGASWPGAAPRAMGFSAGLLALPDTTRDTMDGPRAAVPAVGSVAVSTTAALGGSAVARLPGGAPYAEACGRSVSAPAAAGGGSGSSSVAGAGSRCDSWSGCGSASGSGSAEGSGCGCGSAGGSGFGCGSAGGPGCGCGSAGGSGCGLAGRVGLGLRVGRGVGLRLRVGRGGGLRLRVGGRRCHLTCRRDQTLRPRGDRRAHTTRHREGGGHRNPHPSIQQRPYSFDEAQCGETTADAQRQILSRLSIRPDPGEEETYGTSTDKPTPTIVTAAGRSRKQLIRKITHSC